MHSDQFLSKAPTKSASYVGSFEVSLGVTPCPSWVKPGPDGLETPLAVYPYQRTSSEAVGISNVPNIIC